MRHSSVGLILVCLLVASASPSAAQRIGLPVEPEELERIATPDSNDAQGDIVWLTVGRALTPSGRVIQRDFRGLSADRYRGLAGTLPGAAGR